MLTCSHATYNEALIDERLASAKAVYRAIPYHCVRWINLVPALWPAVELTHNSHNDSTWMPMRTPQHITKPPQPAVA